jgi:RNA recognition motif-containing protein
MPAPVSSDPEESSSPHRNDGGSVGDGDSRRSPCLWVGNVCASLTDADLTKAFSAFGSIVDVRRFASSNCAFITFESVECAVSALALEGTTLGSMRITLNIGQASRHLWVGNLPEHVTAQDITDLFGAYGTVQSTWLMANSRVRLVFNSDFL